MFLMQRGHILIYLWRADMHHMRYRHVVITRRLGLQRVLRHLCWDVLRQRRLVRVEPVSTEYIFHWIIVHIMCFMSLQLVLRSWRVRVHLQRWILHGQHRIMCVVYCRIFL